jgi:hypothetical protein
MIHPGISNRLGDHAVNCRSNSRQSIDPVIDHRSRLSQKTFEKPASTGVIRPIYRRSMLLAPA